jgi:acyl-CoA dehydrogenase
MGTYPVMRFGQPEQVQRWLPAVAAGDAVAALAIAEPGRPAGLPEPVVDLIVEPDGADWRLSGEKTWVCNAPEADFYTVFARMAPTSGSSGVSAFVVPALRPGISGERLEVTGADPVGWLSFDGVPVVQEDLLGAPGQGLEIAARTAAAFRPSAGALALGIARGALEIAAAHATVGGPSGAPVGRQSVTQLLAEMATRTEAARLLVYAAAAASDAAASDAAASEAAEAPARWQAEMGMLYATETAQFVVDAAMQIVGADSLLRGHLLESLSREVRATRLCEGPADVQYGIIAGELLS